MCVVYYIHTYMSVCARVGARVCARVAVWVCVCLFSSYACACGCARMCICSSLSLSFSLACFRLRIFFLMLPFWGFPGDGHQEGEVCMFGALKYESAHAPDPLLPSHTTQRSMKHGQNLASYSWGMCKGYVQPPRTPG